MTSVASFTRGLQQLNATCWAWLEPDGSWGFSNAGLVTGNNESLLVDTLFDLRMAGDLLEATSDITTKRPIQTVVNTHANGDHWYGNQLVADAEIIASTAAGAEMIDASPEYLIQLQNAPGMVGRFARHIFGSFDFSNIQPTPPTRTFDKSLELDIGGTQVNLHVLGPAHTDGDLIVHVPEAKTVYAGDLLFIGGTPVTWAGPVSNWVRACQFMLDLDVDTYVPGHGPVTDKRGVEAVMDYLSYVDEEAKKRCAAGMSPDLAVQDIDLGRFATLGERGRLVQNVLAVYYEQLPKLERVTGMEVFRRMAELEGWKDD